MDSLTDAAWLRRAKSFLAYLFLILAIFCSWSTPALGVSQRLALKPSPITDKLSSLKHSDQRWVEVDLAKQRLVAWVGREPVYAVIVSTGKQSTATPEGVFSIQSMHRLARMQGVDYNLPDVPYTMYYSGNYAIHGTYWHQSFGTPVSHGCINVAVDHARWLFNWASVGTTVVVHD
ncbi:MAG TPA: L,D-transpeptidase [Candidatus Caenarcaniphilales bacterium]